jgi:hypothetical protein
MENPAHEIKKYKYLTVINGLFCVLFNFWNLAFSIRLLQSLDTALVLQTCGKICYDAEIIYCVVLCVYTSLNSVLEMGRYMSLYCTGIYFCSWISYRNLSVCTISIYPFPFFWRYVLVSLLSSALNGPVYAGIGYYTGISFCSCTISIYPFPFFWRYVIVSLLSSAWNHSVYAGILYRNFFLFLNFIPELISMYYIHLFFSIFLTVCPCFAFKQCFKWAGICRYTIPEFLFVPVLYQFILFHFSDGMSLLLF